MGRLKNGSKQSMMLLGSMVKISTSDINEAHKYNSMEKDINKGTNCVNNKLTNATIIYIKLYRSIRHLYHLKYVFKNKYYYYIASAFIYIILCILFNV